MNHDADEQPTEEPEVAPDNEPTAVAAELAALQQERAQLEEQLRRTLADAANMRRRQQKETEDSRRRIIEGFALELLPVLDNFQLALQAWSERGEAADPAALVQGVRMVQTLLTSMLERHGLQEIRAEGHAFDPAVHEAVAVEPTAAVVPGQVLKVLMTGYQLGDRVVRHAKVVVSGEAPRTEGPPPASH